MKKTLIAIGGNLAFGADTLRMSIESGIGALEALAQTPLKRSRLYKTPAFPLGSGADFINAAVEFATAHTPDNLLIELHKIERRFGRTRDARWGARTLDLDIISYDNTVLPDAQTLKRWMAMPVERQRHNAPGELILPHPRMHERAFVLVPLADIAPEWRHPILQKTIREMCDGLPKDTRATIQPLSPEI